MLSINACITWPIISIPARTSIAKCANPTLRRRFLLTSAETGQHDALEATAFTSVFVDCNSEASSTRRRTSSSRWDPGGVVARWLARANKKKRRSGNAFWAATEEAAQHTEGSRPPIPAALFAKTNISALGVEQAKGTSGVVVDWENHKSLRYHCVPAASR